MSQDLQKEVASRKNVCDYFSPGCWENDDYGTIIIIRWRYPFSWDCKGKEIWQVCDK